MSENNNEDWVTQCPNCETSYALTEDAIQAAEGIVRCGNCDETFQSTENLISGDIPEEILQNITIDFEHEDQTDEYMDNDETNTDEYEENFERVEPSDDNTKTNTLSKEKIWLGINIALAFVLLIQLYYNSTWLMTNKVTQVPFIAICNLFNCQLPPEVKVSFYKTLSLTIETDEDDNTLEVKGVVINTASFEQPYPVIQLVFYNDADDIIAKRKFFPYNYLDLREFDSDTPILPPISSESTFKLKIPLLKLKEDPANYKLNYYPDKVTYPISDESKHTNNNTLTE